MKGKLTILSFLVLFNTVLRSQVTTTRFEFCGNELHFQWDTASLVRFQEPLSEVTIQHFYQDLNRQGLEPLLSLLAEYKKLHKPDDWLYYQLIRRTAQQISPKAANYNQYTLYKWWLLEKSGYDVMLTISGKYVLFYVQTDEDIYNIPTRTKNGKQYACLNYHDYSGGIDFNRDQFAMVPLRICDTARGFSYKVSQLPDFNASDYVEKDIRFDYYQNEYLFKLKVNPQIQALFTNYPVVDYASYFNLPLSRETYLSLITPLKKTLKNMKTKEGVEYLMNFTRYAFLFQPDTEVFGGEKRLTAEQTLFSDKSDCEDRVALFFCLVKEIYNLPMIVLNYPRHVTIAVQFDKPVGHSITYNGKQYSICEPSPQKEDLPIGRTIHALKHTSFEVAYSYQPQAR